MTYSYDRTASDRNVTFLRKYVQEAKLFPPILERVAKAVKTPYIAKEAAKIVDHIREVERLMGLLSEPNRKEALSLAMRLVKELDRESIDWSQGDFLGNTGLGERLETAQPEDLEHFLRRSARSFA